MRTITCDRCGCYCTYTTSSPEESDLVKCKTVSIIIGSVRNSNEPPQRVEGSVTMDICESCLYDLADLYETCLTETISRIDKWLHVDKKPAGVIED